MTPAVYALLRRLREGVVSAVDTEHHADAITDALERRYVRLDGTLDRLKLSITPRGEVAFSAATPPRPADDARVCARCKGAL